MIKKIKFLAVMLFVMVATAVQAQVTTSSMSGRVIDADGEIIGATVIATHLPTGTRYGTTTNVEGRFSITGMRVGGPYTVEISFIGYGTHITENITLQLGQEFIHNVFLTEDAVTLNELIVTGVRTRFTTERTGAAMNISNRQMVSMPTVNRNVQDIIRMSPFSGGGMSLAGADGRSTNFTVDGANFNNNMGLTANLPGGGTPISLDALEEMQVVIAPFDVRQTNFIGGGVNAVTRSGTNQLRGSAYRFFNNQKMRGNRINSIDLGERAEESTTIYGFSLGGPIVRDRLFFFVNAELERSPSQVVTWRASQDGQFNVQQQLSRARVSDMQAVRDHLMHHYGYDTGSFTNFHGDESTRRLLARLDWNINQRHRLSVRYNHTAAERWLPPSQSSSFLSVPNRPTPGVRMGQFGMSFANSMYSLSNIVNTFAGELNSRFTDRLSNQLLVTFTDIDDQRGSTSSPFPFVEILPGRNAAGAPILEPNISAGFEPFSWNNGVTNQVFNVTNNFTAFLDNHRITAGISYERQRVTNSFMPTGTGFFRFASLEEFLNREAPIDFSLTYGFGGETNPAGIVVFHQIGAYVQDEWSIARNFRFTYGLRADYMIFENAHTMTNNAIYELNFGGRHLDTGIMPNPRIQLSPRVGFTWDVMGDRSVILRGGTGLFAGRLPLVFLVNQPQRSGMLQGQRVLEHTNPAHIPYLQLLEGGLITDVNKMVEVLGFPATITPEQGTIPAEINITDPNFRMPQVWKSSLALDVQIPVRFPMAVTVEGIFNNMINDVLMENWNLQAPDETWQRFANPNPNNPVYDNRWIFPPLATRRYTPHNAFVLTNTNKGWGAIGNITVTATPVRNLDLMVAYTFTESREMSNMPGNVGSATYGGIVNINSPQLPTLQRSAFVVPHRVIASLNYSTPRGWSGDTRLAELFMLDRLLSNTHISIFYTGRSSGGFSYMFTNSMTGAGGTNELIWIPRERGDIRFGNTYVNEGTAANPNWVFTGVTAQMNEDAFFRFKAQCRYLQRNAGGYAEAFAARAPWVHNFDLRVARDFRVNRNTLQFSIDILNIGNMLSSSWGIPKNMALANNGRILNFAGRDADNVPVFTVHDSLLSEDATPWTTNFSVGNTWRMQFGVRYTFN